MKTEFDGVRIAPNATVVGDVEIGAESSVWYGAVIRGDAGAIRIGKRTNIQDNAIIHDATKLGDDCTVGHGAILHGCRSGDRCIFGMGCIVLNDVTIGDDCLIGAGALVTKRTVIPSGSLVLGNPARIVRELTKDEISKLTRNSEFYLRRSREEEDANWE